MCSADEKFVVFGANTPDGRDIRATNVFASKHAERTDNCWHRCTGARKWKVYYIGGRLLHVLARALKT